MYSTGTANFHGLLQEAERVGLRGRNGKQITLNGLTHLLNSSFYMGLIQIKVSGQSFIGVHEPLISKALFQRVQDVLHGKTNTRTNRHDFLFRRRLCCKSCGYRSEEHTSELQSPCNRVCRLLLEKKKK